MSLLTISINLGLLYGVLIAYYTLTSLTSGNWRLMIILSAIPGFAAWVVGLMFIDESARFAIVTGHYELAFEILNKMNKYNGR